MAKSGCRYHCAYCDADGEQPRCSNCGAPADRAAVPATAPVAVPFDPDDPYGQRAHFAAVAARPDTRDPNAAYEIRLAREWLADNPR
jgi:hypothetical protein